jgi:hypothetical protein
MASVRPRPWHLAAFFRPSNPPAGLSMLCDDQRDILTSRACASASEICDHRLEVRRLLSQTERHCPCLELTACDTIFARQHSTLVVFSTLTEAIVAKHRVITPLQSWFSSLLAYTKYISASPRPLDILPPSQPMKHWVGKFSKRRSGQSHC